MNESVPCEELEFDRCDCKSVQFVHWYTSGQYKGYCEKHKIMDFILCDCEEITKEEYITAKVMKS
jgi:hypothetical protein